MLPCLLRYAKVLWKKLSPSATLADFQPRRTVASGVDDQWQGDLIDLPNPKMFNNGHTLMLIVVEKFSNFAWAEPLKNKTSNSTLKTFAKILSRDGLKTLFLYSDRGLEFANKLFQRYLKKKQIHLLTAQNQETESSTTERMIRTLWSRIWRNFTFKDTERYVDVLPDFHDPTVQHFIAA